MNQLSNKANTNETTYHSTEATPPAQFTILTGATGGIGRAIAKQLHAQGDSLIIIARNSAALSQLQSELRTDENSLSRIEVFTADISSASDQAALFHYLQCNAIQVKRIINNAGVNEFTLFENQSRSNLQRIMAVNILAPMELIQTLLPYLKSQKNTQGTPSPVDIINIGSTFGTIGYPGYCSYSASKFALRGFSEALNRELCRSNIQVRYFAPRATQTALNSAAVNTLNKQLKVAMDSPEDVAKAFSRFVNSTKKIVHIGWPEKMFAKLNQLFPALVGYFIQQDIETIHQYAHNSELNTETANLTI